MNQDLQVSLEPHLADVLRPLTPLLPDSLATDLLSHISESSGSPKLEDSGTSTSLTRTIPYTLLASVSQWTRTSNGLEALSRHNPPLDPRAYEMIALLAGARTSPNKTYPKHVPKERQAEELRKRETSDRKAITALLNSLLSIGGCGFATWYAADRLHWKDEWVNRLS
jgi:hypothetical protein